MASRGVSAHFTASIAIILFFWDRLANRSANVKNQVMKAVDLDLTEKGLTSS